MKYFKYILIFFLFLGCFNFVYAQNEIEQTSAYVLYVIDGDTVRVSIDGKEHRVRLLGIDAPEIVNVEENKEGECFSDEATKKLKELILNKEIVLVNDSLSDDKDKYNRLLRYIYLDDLDVNAELLKDGYAKSFLFFPFDKAQEYGILDNFAKLQNSGLYDPDACSKVVDDTETDTPYLLFGIAGLAILLIIIFLKKND